MSALLIYIPGDAAAVAVGADEVAAAIKAAAARSRTPVTIVRNGSRGMHWLEPMLEIATDKGRTAYGPVELADVESVFAAMLAGGAEHKLRIGVPEQHPFLKTQTRLTFARCGIVDPRSLEDYRARDGYKGLAEALGNPAAIVEAITQSGLRGRGGAGFPTGIKWQTVAAAAADRKYIVCNADEGDSGTFADRMIMEGDPFLLIEGMTTAGIAVGATQGYIYVRSEYPHAVAALNGAIGAARRHGMLGRSVAGSLFAFDLEV
ncbi:MAG TPA: formate dehydrogenase, partial [Xanthobacteraceae bacterium]|nr:formate dehydrogenase [Xanthobacteraceae bacterium]